MRPDPASPSSPESAAGRLIQGDNLEVMSNIQPASVDLIYADPPFFTGRRQARGGVSFEDAWRGGIDTYLEWLSPRLAAMRRLLKPCGSIYVHCDWHAGHYIKVEMDRLFGAENFLNEIVWCYKSGGASPARRFSRKHDVLFFYRNGPSYYFQPQTEKSYNRERRPYRFAGVPEFEDEGGWYTVVGMKDWWEIEMVGRTSRERAGYPTQKPLKLLDRIIRASCPPGGLVADFFCGSGTAAIAAMRCGRRWLVCDESAEAVRITQARIDAENTAPAADGQVAGRPNPECSGM